MGVEARILDEVGRLVQNPSDSLSLADYLKGVAKGMQEYMGIIVQRRHKLLMEDMLGIYSRHVLRNSNPESDTTTGRILGTYYVNGIVHEVLTHRIGEDYMFAEISLDIGTVAEIHSRYNSLLLFVIKSIMENDSTIMIPGEKLNIGAVRPKNPHEAILN